MTVGEMIEHLKLHDPKMELWTAKDAEGNGYNETHYSPTVMWKDASIDYDPDMYGIDDLEKDEDNDFSYVKVVVI